MELAAILRDYEERIEKLGPETLRLRGESFAEWESKRRRTHVYLELLEVAAEGRPLPIAFQEEALLDDLLHGLASAPPVPEGLALP